jgi:CheY-like chemotaxis protein
MASRFLKPKMRILVVDDDPDIRACLCDLLTHWHYKVTPAASGCEALEAVQRGSVDAVLLDVTMPVMDGAETLGEIKRVAPDLPVIMMSALMTADLKPHLYELGARACLAKPLNREALAVTLIPLLGKEIGMA